MILPQNHKRILMQRQAQLINLKRIQGWVIASTGFGLTKINLCFGYSYSSKYNCQFNDAETHAAVLYGMELYKQFGGGAIVENSSHGLPRNVKFLKEVSQRTGVHVIAGTVRNYADFQTSYSYLLDKPASWSGGQSFWLLIMMSWVRFPVLPMRIYPWRGRFPWWPWSG